MSCHFPRLFVTTSIQQNRKKLPYDDQKSFIKFLIDKNFMVETVLDCEFLEGTCTNLAHSGYAMNALF